MSTRVYPKKSDSPMYSSKLEQALAELGLNQVQLIRLVQQTGTRTLARQTLFLMVSRSQDAEGRVRSFYKTTVLRVLQALQKWVAEHQPQAQVALGFEDLFSVTPEEGPGAESK